MASDPQYVTDSEGKRTAVLLPLDTYEAMLEDLRDLAFVAERGNEERVSLDEVRRKLKADGFLPD